MTQNITTQIENINKSLEWIKKNKPEDYEQKFLQLVEERRKLKKLVVANRENPAIAAYGVSQVGKSYLMNCILQKDGEPFLIEADGKKYKFIEEMNPKTSNTEATGVVTRFSSFSRDAIKYSKEYPILMKCLTIADVILIISDGYYNDISDYTTYSEAEIAEIGEDLYKRYINMPVIPGSAISPDSIMDIRAYYKKHINNARAFIHASFFDKLALVADRIPASDWESVFSTLWHNSEHQNRLFTTMLATLKKLQFSTYVYLPAQALLHNGINENTVMSVQCLNGLFLERPHYFTDAYIRHGDSYTKIANLTKSEICAVCAEIVVKITDDYINANNSYSLCNIHDKNVMDQLSMGRRRVEKLNSVTNKIDVSYETSVEVLKENDLLDFPGARSRKKELLCTLQGDSILINVLLRGKVAYLFNTYNESMLINILLYCHHEAQNDVNDIPLLLNDWIQTYVGNTMEKRKRTLELTGGISPLFYIGTKFNIDMQQSTEEVANNINSLNNRWFQRFEKVLYHQCFNADGSLDSQQNKIFFNWTQPDESFSNSYILRDYKFSGPLESKLYDKENSEDRCMTIPEEHYNNLRETFCASKSVSKFFKWPELAWDVCASIDNDGSQYIIAQLDKVASRMGITRDEQFRSILRVASRTILSVMQGYYVSTDVDEMLESNISKARSIFREMDFTCNTDNYYFGHLLQALQISETECYKTIHSLLQSSEMNDKVNEFKDYEIIRSSCKKAGFQIEIANDDDAKWQCLINTYGFMSQNEAMDFLSRRQIDYRKLFDGSHKRKCNSCIIGDAIFDLWCSKIKSIEFLHEFSNEHCFDGNIMTVLVDNLINTAKALQIRDRLSESIAEYVNVVNIHTVNESLIADILPSIINDYILDFGFKYLSVEDVDKVRQICKSRNIPAFDYMCRDEVAAFEEEDLTRLFNEISKNPQLMLPSFDDNYNKWMEYMFISFVAHLDVPEFDHQANVALSQIIGDIKGIA
ncbi:MAG: hypothetical protein IKV04_01600 [Alistipes sp.]|nr:hypothetical protein [Alistipes sp.]